MRIRIPRSFKLPFSYKVKVRLVSRAQLARVMRRDDTEAGWDVDLQTIYILKTLSKPMQLERFLHEFEHLKADWRLAVRQEMGLEG